MGDGGFGAGFDRLFIRDIKRENRRSSASGGDLRGYFIQLCFVAGRQRNPGAGRGQSQ